uniref:Uncharacterized protein n=1 Tax=Monopterus albus TaxID=43700 RepID=A0A3Q3JT81_MONAL
MSDSSDHSFIPLRIQRMTTLLTEKEDAMRKLREALRKSQQQGEESCKCVGGWGSGDNLFSGFGLVSSQQAEIGKWKSRAFKLKVKSKAEVDKPLSPCTPTKRALPMTSDSSNFNSPKKLVVASKNPLDSPRKLLESPKVSLSDSPKSRLFDVDGSSDMLSRALPKQFFDNSSFLTIPVREQRTESLLLYSQSEPRVPPGRVQTHTHNCSTITPSFPQTHSCPNLYLLAVTQPPIA